MPISEDNYNIEFLIRMIKGKNCEAVKEWLALNRKKQMEKKGYDLTQCYGSGFSEQPVLFTAIYQKDLEMFSLLAEETKENLCELTEKTGDTLLHLVIQEEWIDGLQYIVDKHRDFIRKDDFFDKGLSIFFHLISKMSSLEKRENSLKMLDLILRLEKIDSLLTKLVSRIAFNKIDDIFLKKTIAESIVKYFNIDPYSSWLRANTQSTSKVDDNLGVGLSKLKIFTSEVEEKSSNDEPMSEKETEFNTSFSNGNLHYLKTKLINVSTFFKRRPYKLDEEENSLKQPLTQDVGKK